MSQSQRRGTTPNLPDGTGGVEVCMSNSFGFGGQNDTITIRRFVA